MRVESNRLVTVRLIRLQQLCNFVTVRPVKVIAITVSQWWRRRQQLPAKRFIADCKQCLRTVYWHLLSIFLRSLFKFLVIFLFFFYSFFSLLVFLFAILLSKFVFCYFNSTIPFFYFINHLLTFDNHPFVQLFPEFCSEVC